MDMLKPRLLVLITMVLVAAASRLIPHPPNLASIRATSIRRQDHGLSARRTLAAPLRSGGQARRGLHHFVRARRGPGVRAAARRGRAGDGADRLAGGGPFPPCSPPPRHRRHAVDNPPFLRLRPPPPYQRAVQDAA